MLIIWGLQKRCHHLARQDQRDIDEVIGRRLCLARQIKHHQTIFRRNAPGRALIRRHVAAGKQLNHVVIHAIRRDALR
ncbi:hypothetical protein [Falsiruegeria mediterranea]|uniref:hypothetical protein n=1 Tax=Falsiruegeria mediterranea TaxID=1280832 RepID=UPI00351FF444